jgi:electron transport complex protein RnfB
MQEDVFQRLARILDELPNRFPATESGAEIRLLEKLFTPEEAALACVLKLDAESSMDIATHAGMDPKDTRDTLKRKG